jgi:hypothetical protein
MPFAYYDRLAPARKAIYRRSDAIVALPLPPGTALGPTVAAIRKALADDRRLDVQRACQKLCDVLTAGYRVPPVRVVVMERRPADDYGELHGLYEPAERRRRARITVWMRTAARQQVVAFKSFLRTVVHELAHHLDYELFALEETFHTEGFYKRESSLANALFAQAAARPDAARGAAG